MAEYLINIEGKTYEIDILDDNRVILNGNEISFDLKYNGNDSYTLIYQNKIFEVDVISNNNSILQLSVDNDVYDIVVKDKFTQLLEKFSKGRGEREKEILIQAPMPGLVLKISVEIGQKVEPGTSLLILEAMKMENEIRAFSAGIVKDIKIKEKTAVEKGDVLIILE